MKKYSYLIVLLLNLICFQSVFSQDLPEVINSNPLYSNEIDIINGYKWNYEKRYRGIPFISEESWVTGKVWYNGDVFTGVKMNYDLYTDEFIVFYANEEEKKFIVLADEYLEKFSFLDPFGKTRVFQYFQLSEKGKKKLYEIAYAGNSLHFLIFHNVTIQSKVSGGFLGDYIRSSHFYVKTGDNYIAFRKKKELLSILNKHYDDIKIFMKKNKLKVRKKRIDDIARIIEYYDQLEADMK